MAKRPYRIICETYFGNKDNKPFSIQEICGLMDIDPVTLQVWETGGDPKLATLARRIRTRVAAGWEKGEVSPSLAIFLLKQYMGHEEKKAGPLEIILKVMRDGD